MTTMPNNIWQLLQWRSQLCPDKPFVTDAQSGKTLSFSTFSQYATALAQTLAQQGVQKGSVVAWQLPTSIDAALLMFALSRLETVQAPIIHLYREREIQQIVIQAQPQFIIVMDEVGKDILLRRAQAVIKDLAFKPALIDYRSLSIKLSDNLGKSDPLPAHEPVENAVLWYYFTSGTTARPKGAKHSDQSLLAGGFFLGNALHVNEQDVGSIAYPVAHIGGIVYFAMALKFGIPVILLANYTADLVIHSFQHYKVTLAGGSTAHYQLLLEEQRKRPNSPLFPSLRLLSGGGAAKPAALYWQVKDELGVRIIHAYGMTEAPITSSNTPYDSDEQLTNTDGEVLPELELDIIDTQGRRVNSGEAGEIILRGPNLCQGYLLEEQTTAAFDEHGFYHTGDLGKMDVDGHLSITGRLKEIIIRKGENISAREIEELLARHPAVKDAVVIGLPDEERGELVCAVIELVDPAVSLTLAAMQEFLKSHQLMRQKIPERIEILDRLPRNESLQKVQKNFLVTQFS